LIHDIPSAGEIVRRMAGEAEALLRGSERHRLPDMSLVDSA
jgi:hypothetical protein